MSEMDKTTREIVTRLREAASDADHIVTSRGGSNDLAMLAELLPLADALMATAVAATRNVVDTDAAEKDDGFDVETWLRLRTRRTYGDSKMLVETAEVLRHLPRASQAWRDGVIGWGEVRLLVLEARGLSPALLARLDAMLCDDLERLARFEAAVVVGAVREAVARLRPDLNEKTEQRAVDHRFVAVQQAFDGSGSLYGEFDPQGLDTVVAAIDRAADLLPGHTDPDQLHTHDCPTTRDSDRDVAGDGDRRGGGDGEGVGEGGCTCGARPGLSRGRRRAEGLVLLAENHLAGQGGQRARPTVIVTADAATVLNRHTNPNGDAGGRDGELLNQNVDRDGDRVGAGAPRLDLTEGVPQLDLADGVAQLDLDDVVGLRFGDHDPNGGGLAPVGQLLWGSHAGPITLSETELERLMCEADVQLVLRDGRRIVGTLSDDRYATDAQRQMLTARDHHCRFVGCTAPATICVAHHVVPWPDGPTDLPNLALLCPLHHRTVHHRGWTMTIDDDAVCVFRRGRRTYTTYPPDMRRLEPRAGPDP